jgi:excinuclease ABC subunit C
MTKILTKNSIQIIKNELLKMPNKPGVYRMLDENEIVLYVGKAKDLAKRIANYTQVNRLCNRMRLAINQTKHLEIITTNTEAQALILEASLIKSLKPKYNILLTDDKSMPYILFKQDHEYNQILKYRGKRDIKGKYFGPFASPRIVTETIEFLEKNFLLRSCTDSFFSSRKHPCLQYQLKRCSAPCVGKISLLEYQHNVKQALSFLQGKTSSLQQEISLLMQNASDNMEYEKAAKHRDQLKSLNYIQNKNGNLFNIENADVVGIAKEGDLACVQIFFFRNGQNYGNRCFFFDKVQDEDISKILSIFIAQFYQNNQIPEKLISTLVPEELEDLIEALSIKFIIAKKGNILDVGNFAKDNAIEALSRRYKEKEYTSDLLNQVEDLFNIGHRVNRIEIYDNSHISGSHAVGVMVVAGENGFIKKSYRKYNITVTDKGDDYAMVKEVLSRRLAKLTEGDRPDLLMIDGGEGQLTAARSVLDSLSLDIPLVCISKGVDRNAGREVFHQTGKNPFTLDKHSSLMKYLQILRDEAHRFAITSHRKKRSQAIGFSSLKEIAGVGPKRRKALINHFTSMQEIKDANIENLRKIDGINQKIAEEIVKYFLR